MTGESGHMTAKERLLFWSRQTTDGYVGVRCDNFTTSWRDGRLFNAIIHKYRYTLKELLCDACCGFSGILSTSSVLSLLVAMPCFSRLTGLYFSLFQARPG